METELLEKDWVELWSGLPVKGKESNCRYIDASYRKEDKEELGSSNTAFHSWLFLLWMVLGYPFLSIKKGLLDKYFWNSKKAIDSTDYAVQVMVLDGINKERCVARQSQGGSPHGSVHSLDKKCTAHLQRAGSPPHTHTRKPQRCSPPAEGNTFTTVTEWMLH